MSMWREGRGMEREDRAGTRMQAGFFFFKVINYEVDYMVLGIWTMGWRKRTPWDPSVECWQAGRSIWAHAGIYT